MWLVQELSLLDKKGVVLLDKETNVHLSVLVAARPMVQCLGRWSSP